MPLLRTALQSLCNQVLSEEYFEVIVVDNGSSDGTEKACSEFTGVLPGFKYVRENRPGLHAARHAGARIAKGDIIVYGDDDIKATPAWLQSVNEAFRNESVGLVGGPSLGEFEGEVPDWIAGLWQETPTGRALIYYSLQEVESGLWEIHPNYVWGCNFSIRKNLLYEVGGFHPDSMPPELLRRRGDGENATALAVLARGYKVLCHSEAKVYHRVTKERLTLEYLFKRAHAQGVSDSYSLTRRQGCPERLSLVTLWLNDLRHSAVNIVQRRNRIERLMRTAYLEGYAWHQREIRSDPDLLSWVLRSDYWTV